ncbi:hypothetical protein [Pedobacter panaciterrae]
MKQSEEYINNLKGQAFVLNCNLSNLDMGVPNLDELLSHCGFDNQFITTMRQQIESDDLQSVISYVPSFIQGKVQVDEFEKEFDLIIARKEFGDLKIQEHRDNLLLLILLLHDYYFLDGNGDLLYRIKYKTPFHKLPYEELPDATQELMKGKEVADLLEILLQIKQTDKEFHMQIGRSHGMITNSRLRSKLVESIESTLLNSTYDDLGAGLELVIKYIDYQKTGNDVSLKTSIDAIKSVQKTTPAPLLNKAIANFSLLIRNYLVHNGRSNTLPLWPNDLLMFIEATFVLLKLDYKPSSGSIKHLRKTIGDYSKTH